MTFMCYPPNAKIYSCPFVSHNLTDVNVYEYSYLGYVCFGNWYVTFTSTTIFWEELKKLSFFDSDKIGVWIWSVCMIDDRQILGYLFRSIPNILPGLDRLKPAICQQYLFTKLFLQSLNLFRKLDLDSRNHTSL